MMNVICNSLQRLRQSQPLILNITNLVTMDFIANGLLALGASPIMTQAEEELEALVRLSSCVVINLGTLNAPFLSLANQACALANQYHKPLVLDPVGAGATPYRTQAALTLMKQHQFQIIRANASEIAAISGADVMTKGVDSAIQTHEAIDAAQSLAYASHTVLCVSGETDYIVDASRLETCHHGSPLMPKVTGTGCLLSAVVAAFHAVEPDPFQAAFIATYYYALCGEQAAKQAHAPGHFKPYFIDALSELMEA